MADDSLNPPTAPTEDPSAVAAAAQPTESVAAQPTEQSVETQPTTPSPIPVPVTGTSATPDGQVDVVNPEGEYVSIPKDKLAQALSMGYTQPTAEAIHTQDRHEKYGSTGQMIKTAAEGVASGLLGSTIKNSAEIGLGIATPEDIKGREEENPYVHGVSEFGGFVGGALSGVGEAALLADAGHALAAASGIGKAAKAGSFVAKYAPEAARGLFEGALYEADQQVGNTVKDLGKTFKEDPAAAAGHALVSIGLSAALGGVFSVGISAAMRKMGIHPEQVEAAKKAIAEGKPVDPVTKAAMAEAEAKKTTVGEPTSFVEPEDQLKADQGDFKAGIEQAENLTGDQKEQILAQGKGKISPEAAEARAIAKKRGLPDLPEGMVSDNKMVKMGEDSLLNSPTSTGEGRRAIYDKVYKSGNALMNEGLGEGSALSMAENGREFKQSLDNKVRKAFEPLQQGFEELKGEAQQVPVHSVSAKGVARDILSMEKVLESPSSPGAQLARTKAPEIAKLKSVESIRSYMTSLRQELQGENQQTKYIGAQIMNKLRGMEEEAIVSHAKNRIAALSMTKDPALKAAAQEESENILANLTKRRELNAKYKGEIGDLSTLAEKLGYGKIEGMEDALHFINERLTPEQVTERLFAKKDADWLSFFSKKYPEEFQQMRLYQKSVVRQSASKDGVLNASKLVDLVAGMQKETRQAIFTPEELNKIYDANTYLKRIPKSYNPSGTATVVNYRNHFADVSSGIAAGTAVGGPVGAVIGGVVGHFKPEITDRAILQFMKTKTGLPNAAKAAAIAESPQMAQAAALADATVKGDKLASSAIKSVFTGLRDKMPDAVVPPLAHRAKLSMLVDKYQEDPDKLMSQNDQNPIPEYAQAFTATAGRAVKYLASIKPNNDPKSPMDTRIPVTAAQTAAYNRALDIAQQPLNAIKRMQDGNLTQQDMMTLKTIHPDVYRGLVQKMMTHVVANKDSGDTVPYKTRLQLSMFMGQPLDGTMTQPAMAAIQANSRANQAAAQQQKPPSASSTKGLSKLGQTSQTATQSREEARASGQKS